MKNENLNPEQQQEARPSVTSISDQCDQVETDFGVLSRRLVPMLIDGVSKTDGTEGAKISITISFMPGESKSKSLLSVVGKVTIPGGGFEHEVGMREGKNGNQLVLFTD